MEMNTAAIEPVTLSDILELASWDRPRSSEELREFLAVREDIVANS